MRQIGIVKFVQIQRASLKSGERPYRIYHPAPLQQVPSLWVASDGVFGQANDASWTIDVHHAQHPASRNSGGYNGVSFNFTPHYSEIRTQFGDHLVDGCAGENILIESDSRYNLADLGKRVAFQRGVDGELVYLDALRVAAPCVEFSHYVNKSDLVTSALQADTLKSTLQFLDAGRRGFYAQALQPGLISTGDAVFIED